MAVIFPQICPISKSGCEERSLFCITVRSNSEGRNLASERENRRVPDSREAQILGILKSGTRVRVRAATVDNALWSTIYDVSNIPLNLRTISTH